MLLSGVLALCLHDVLGSGHAMIEMLSEDPIMLLRTLFLLLAVKFAFSLVSFGSGAPGGFSFHCSFWAALPERFSEISLFRCLASLPAI